MKTKLLLGLLALCCVAVAVGPAAADSNITYPDGSFSLAQYIGGNAIAFIFNDVPGDSDYFIHVVNFAANLSLAGLPVSGGAIVNGFAFWLDFEGFNQGFLQYGVYSCTGVQTNCGFNGRRGTLFL